MESYHQRMRRLNLLVGQIERKERSISEIKMDDLHFLLGRGKIAELAMEENRILRERLENAEKELEKLRKK